MGEQDAEDGLEEIEARIASIATYRANTVKALKKYRQMRGAAAQKQVWDAEARIERYDFELARLEASATSLRGEPAAGLPDGGGTGEGHVGKRD